MASPTQGGPGGPKEEFHINIMSPMYSRMPIGKRRLLYFGVTFASCVLFQLLACYAMFRHRNFFWGVLVCTLVGLFLAWKESKRQTKVLKEAVNKTNVGFNVHLSPCMFGVGVGMVLGIFLGLYNYDSWYVYFEYQANASQYTNVVATASGRSYSDAGVLNFSTDSFVDATKALGYRFKGDDYCVAPVLSLTTLTSKDPIERVDFWAVGKNCCSLGAFSCDDSKKSNDPNNTRKWGNVVFETDTWFGAASKSEIYARARNKAIAEFFTGADGKSTIKADTDPINPTKTVFIRWVEDSRTLPQFWLNTSYIFFGVSSIVSGILSYGLAILFTTGGFTPSAKTNKFKAQGKLQIIQGGFTPSAKTNKFKAAGKMHAHGGGFAGLAKGPAGAKAGANYGSAL